MGKTVKNSRLIDMSDLTPTNATAAIQPEVLALQQPLMGLDMAVEIVFSTPGIYAYQCNACHAPLCHSEFFSHFIGKMHRHNVYVSSTFASAPAFTASATETASLGDT